MWDGERAIDKLNGHIVGDNKLRGDSAPMILIRQVKKDSYLSPLLLGEGEGMEAKRKAIKEERKKLS
jgi:hypothetical protein